MEMVTWYLTSGLLSEVQNLSLSVQNSSAIITWVPPYTLDVTDVARDIDQYCVDIVNSTSLLSLLSECGISTTEFIYELPDQSVCARYNFTIIPVNRVGNGTMAFVIYHEAQNSKCVYIFASCDYILDVL